MNPLDIARLILKLAESLKDGQKWQASHKVNNVQTAERPAVSRFVCGLAAGEGIWFQFEFKESAKDHTLRGSFAVDNRNEIIKFDGADVEDDDVILSHRFRGAELRGVVEFEFLLNGQTHRYRFDATLMRA